MPALLKARLEPVMRAGVALEYRKLGFPRQLLTRLSAWIIFTMVMPGALGWRRGSEYR